MYDYPENDFRSYLQHHGILLQKWGERHGPPYPLSYDAHSSAQKSANSGKHNLKKYDDIKSEAQKKKYLKDRANAEKYRTGESKKKIKNHTGTSVFTNSHDDEWEEMLSTRKTPGLAEMLSGVTKRPITMQNTRSGEKLITATSYLREQVDRAKDRGFDDMRWHDSNVSDMRSLVSRGQVNPGFGERGTTQNCTKATFATELLRRGISGAVAGRQSYPASSNAMSYWFKGAHSEKVRDASSADTLINGYGENSSGYLRVQFEDNSSGHALHWTKSGKSYSIEDGQVGKVWEGSSFSDVFKKYNNDNSFFKIDSIARLDNCEINWENAEEDACIRGNSVWNHKSKRIVDTW